MTRSPAATPLVLAILIVIFSGSRAVAQSMVPATDGTGTIVTPTGDRLTISGGQASSDGANLFHSFQRFVLDAHQTATFLANPAVQTILTRVIGGEASVIQGQLQVLGNAHLFLVNPAGIVFGSTARLDVPGSFTATTANGIQLGSQAWTLNSTNYPSLVGNPTAFQFFTAQPGAIVNTGNLSVGQNLTLLGGTVVNTGSLLAPNGGVTIAAVPGESLVRFSQPGSLLNLEITPIAPASSANFSGLSAVSLPTLLTGGGIGSATGVTVSPDGSVKLTGSEAAIAQGDVAISGTIRAIGDVNLFANHHLQVRDSAATSTMINAGGKLTMQGNQGIDLLTLNTVSAGIKPFQSGKDLTLISDGVISMDAHFTSGGNLSLQTLRGDRANARSLYDPVITVAGSYSGGDYVGPSLLVTAGGDISYGSIVINGIDTAVHPTNPALFLRAGGNIDISGDIQTGDGLTNLLVDLIAGETITTQSITTQGGSIGLLNITGNGNTLTGILNTNAVEGDAGDININTKNNVTIAAIAAIAETSMGASGNGGNVSLISQQGNVVVGDGISTFSRAMTDASGNGGQISISTPLGSTTVNGDIITTSSSQQNNSGNAGSLQVFSRDAIQLGTIATFSQAEGSQGNAGTGGLVELDSRQGAIATGNISTRSTAVGTGDSNDSGGISIITRGTSPSATLRTGELSTDSLTLADTVTARAGNAGSVTLQTDAGSMTTGGIFARSLGVRAARSSNGGAVQAITQGGSLTVNGPINSQSYSLDNSTGNAGDIRLSAQNSIQSGVITASSGNTSSTTSTTVGNGGSVAVTSEQGSITIPEISTVTFISQDGSSGNGGAVDLTTNSTTGGGIAIGDITTLTTSSPSTTATTNIGSGGAVTLRSAGSDIQTGGISTISISRGLGIAGNGGAISLTANGNIATQFLETNVEAGQGNGGNAGNITVTTEGTLTTDRLSAAVNRSPTGLAGNGGTIALTAKGALTTRSIDTHSDALLGGAVRLTSQTASLTTDRINTTGQGGGGLITLTGKTALQTGILNTSSTNGNGGSVSLSGQAVTVSAIDSQGAGLGGHIDITANGFFRATDSFRDRTGTIASLSSAGGLLGGNITIQHSGGYVGIPFSVGNATINGTTATITTGNQFLAATDYPVDYRQTSGLTTIHLVTKPSSIPPVLATPPIAPPATPPASPVPLPSSPPTLSVIPPSESSSAPPLSATHPTSALEPTPISLRDPILADTTFSQTFRDHLGLTDSPQSTGMTLVEAQKQAAQIEQLTQARPAFIYLSFLPAIVEEKGKLVHQRDRDVLELLLISAQGEPVRKVRHDLTRSQVLSIAQKFRATVTNRRSRNYIPIAQQMYDIVLAPLASDLQARGITNLLFIPDSGLRSLPYAALHDGEKFLVERYSMGLAPSLSLIDFRYHSIKKSPMVAMGASQFTEHFPLPGVPLELSEITQGAWQGKALLNEAFTLNNLMANRQASGILHLATHGEFKPGAANQSYIQLWDSKLTLDQMNRLGDQMPLELLVLSACRTALGDEQAELGFAGLATRSGVKSALASLWYISDEGALALMTEFYHHLADPTVTTKSEALRRAQVALLKGEITIAEGKLRLPARPQGIPLPRELAQADPRGLAHPYTWAAFMMIGNPW